MPGTITLPQIVLEDEQEIQARRQAPAPPRTVLVRYGYMGLIAELPYEGRDPIRPGDKLVILTERGTELAEMLAVTSPEGLCPLTLSRRQIQAYIERSGGKGYPFSTTGRVLRPAQPQDLLEQQKLDARKPEIMAFTRQRIAQLNLPMKLVEVELLLGGERIIFHYVSEQWVDFRELVRLLAAEYQTRIEMHQVSARDEARLIADYERCGLHCCCRQFLKVLRPVSMRMAKIQKATLDPGKISGRCGRLMCCLRYEDETYETLRKRLPRKQTRVMTPEGPGTVVDVQILTQLVLVKLDLLETPRAWPVEEIQPLPPEKDPLLNKTAAGPLSDEQAASSESMTAASESSPPSLASSAPQKPTPAAQASAPSPAEAAPPVPAPQASPSRGYSRSSPPAGTSSDSSGQTGTSSGSSRSSRRRRRRRRRRGKGSGGNAASSGG